MLNGEYWLNSIWEGHIDRELMLGKSKSLSKKKTVGVGVLKLSLDQVFLIEQEEYKGFLYIYYQKKPVVFMQFQ